MRVQYAILTAAVLAFAGCSETQPLEPGDPSLAQGGGIKGLVFTQTNAAAGNAVLVFDRAADGSLVPAGSIPTGGFGTGAGLGSQGALELTEDGNWLLAVNAGSDDVTVFRVKKSGLEWVDMESSSGDMPISVTENKGTVYVLNAGGAGNISGFRLSHHGELIPIAGSSRPLSGAGTGPAQVGFNMEGDLLVVTEKATNKILTYTVRKNRLANGPMVSASSGATPFGFAFSRRDRLIVSEAFGGAPDASAASSYIVSDHGSLTLVSPSVSTTETAACWVAVSRNGKYAYVTNTGSGSVSGYSIDNDGSLSLLDADGRTGVVGPGNSPIDAEFSGDGRYLYVLGAGAHTISGFEFNADGSLTSAGSVPVPVGAVGLAAN